MNDTKQQCDQANVSMPTRLARVKLAKISNEQLENKLAELRAMVATANANLVDLLIEKDALFMERDSILVDLEDLEGFQGGNKTVVELVEEILQKSNS